MRRSTYRYICKIETFIIAILLALLFIMSLQNRSQADAIKDLKSFKQNAYKGQHHAIIQIYNDSTGEYDTYSGTLDSTEGLYGNFAFGDVDIRGVLKDAHNVGSVKVEEDNNE